MTRRPIYRPGATVTVPAEYITRSGTRYVVCESPCCGVRTWVPDWTIQWHIDLEDHPMSLWCGRANDHRVVGDGCDWRWTITARLNDDAAELTWTA